MDSYKAIFDDYHKIIEDEKYPQDIGDELKSFIYSIEHSPLALGHAHYVVDYHSKKIVYQKGIKEFLGYEENEFTTDKLGDYIHPDDKERYTFIVKSVIDYFTDNTTEPLDVMFSITGRIRKKDDSYLTVLRSSTIIEVNENKKMTKNYSMLTDVSAIRKNNQVMWDCISKGVDTSSLKKFIQERHKNYFTPRETEILHLLREGLGSKQIAEKLFISKHTIDTHRRRMLSKATCTNTIELLDFARCNSII